MAIIRQLTSSMSMNWESMGVTLIVFQPWGCTGAVVDRKRLCADGSMTANYSRHALQVLKSLAINARKGDQNRTLNVPLDGHLTSEFGIRRIDQSSNLSIMR
jgi:hypothetical protein